MPFSCDLALGNFYEQEYINHVKPTEFKIMKGKFKEYDIEMVEDGKTYYVEVKSDRLTHKTGNICIEFMCGNNPSGIKTTTADYYIYFEIEPESTYSMYKIPVERLREEITNKTYHKTMRGGDGYRSHFYLFRKTLFEDCLC